MRYVVLFFVLFFGACDYDTYNYYCGPDGAVVDGGLVDATAGDGDEMGISDNIFIGGSKLQGNAIIELQPSPVVLPGPIPYWPPVQMTPAYQHGVTLIDVETTGHVPRVVTISMGMISAVPTQDTGTAANEVVAVIELGVGGLAYFAEVDFVQGVQFSVSASRVKLTAVFRCLPGDAWVFVPGSTRPTANVGAALSLGVMAHGRQPQRTLGKASGLPTGGLGPGLHEHWIIPTFAKSMRAVAVPYTTSQLQFDLMNWTTNPCAQFAALAWPTVDYPIPSDARYVTASNTNIVGIVDYRMVFELAL